MNEKIAKEAYSWLNTPHVNGAKVKGRGVDCGMLLIGCLEGAGCVEKGEIKIPPYSNEWHLHHSQEWFKHYVESYCEKVEQGEPEPGDFLLYQYGRCISHGAVYIGSGLLIHAVVDQGVIMSDMDDVSLKDKKGCSRLRGVYRFKNREEGK